MATKGNSWQHVDELYLRLYHRDAMEGVEGIVFTEYNIN